ncbi:hypothetical protein J6590_004770, partial [Homalodisca vitripennis]
GLCNYRPRNSALVSVFPPEASGAGNYTSEYVHTTSTSSEQQCCRPFFVLCKSAIPYALSYYDHTP